jgi:hypothetical protein
MAAEIAEFHLPSYLGISLVVLCIDAILLVRVLRIWRSAYVRASIVLRVTVRGETLGPLGDDAWRGGATVTHATLT